MCKWNNGGIPVKLPDNICTWKENRTVCIDECIIKQIKILWENGYETLGCCCGHDKSPNPDLVISESYTKEDILKIKKILSDNDDRCWKIMQWNLIEV